MSLNSLSMITEYVKLCLVCEAK